MNESTVSIAGIVVGRLTGEDADGNPLVICGDQDRARSARAVWMPRQPRWSACRGMPVAIGLVGGDPESPVVLGLLGTPPSSAIRPAEISAPPAPGVEAPKVLRIESEEELVLECGKAKVALRADGRVEIRGGYLLSRSTGANKIKGGSVHIN